MKLNVSLFGALMVVGAALGVTSAQAQLTWSASQLSGAGDALTSGSGATLLAAGDFTSTNAGDSFPGLTVNTVTFTELAWGATKPTYSTSVNGLSVSVTDNGTKTNLAAYYQGSSTYWGGFSTSYQELLSGFLAGGGTGDDGTTFTIGGLTSGQSYILRFWESDPYANSFNTGDIVSWSNSINDSTLSVNEATSAGGSYVTVDFTAEGSSLTLTSTGYAGALNAFEVLETPEPSTMALCVVAAGLVGWVAVRRRTLALAK
jgi:PEP-CTERM motif